MVLSGLAIEGLVMVGLKFALIAHGGQSVLVIGAMKRQL